MVLTFYKKSGGILQFNSLDLILFANRRAKAHYLFHGKGLGRIDPNAHDLAPPSEKLARPIKLAGFFRHLLEAYL
jgi:hypothetical protein